MIQDSKVIASRQSPKEQLCQSAGQDAVRQALLSKICASYPQTFNLKDPKPLKIGIFQDLCSLFKEQSLKAQLRKALAYYTYNIRYQKALATQDHRYNLQGQIEGEVTEEHKAKAHAQLMKMKKGYKSHKVKHSPNSAPLKKECPHG